MPFCAEDIQDAAIVCRYCSADLVKGQSAARGTTTVVVENKKVSPGVAAVLSLIIPGAGQMYCGRVGEGLFGLVIVVLGYVMFVLPGLVPHVICIFGAATSANSVNRATATAAVIAGPTAAAAPPVPPRPATRTEAATGGALAALANTVATFRVGRQSHKALVVVVYLVAALLILRQLWIGPHP